MARTITTETAADTTQYSVAGIYGRRFTDATTAQAWADALPDGYTATWVTKTGFSAPKPGWVIEGPGGYKSPRLTDLDTVRAHLAAAIATQGPRVARKDAAEVERTLTAIEQSAAQARADLNLATPAQVDYILRLLATRDRTGDMSGFFYGPTTTEGVRAMTKAAASDYIRSLTGRY